MKALLWCVMFCSGILAPVIAAGQSSTWAQISQTSPEHQYHFYTESVRFFTDDVAKSNPFLASRMTTYFLGSPDANGQAERYATYRRVLQNLASKESPSEIRPDSVVEHMASSHFGRFYRVASAAADSAGASKQKDDAALRAAGVTDDVEAPIKLLGSGEDALSFARRVLIYEECADHLMRNLQAKRPDLIPHFQEFFWTPLDSKEGFPMAFNVYQKLIDAQIKTGDPKMMILSASKVLHVVGSTELDELAKAKPSAKP